MEFLAPALSPRTATGLRRLAFAASLAAAAGLSVPATAQDISAAAAGTITMDGRGSVSVAPDMAVITARVVTLAPEAPEALARNSEKLTRVIDDIKAAGIEAKDIQTSGFGIFPRYERPNGGSEGGQPEITGYEVRNGVDINVRDLGKLGGLLGSVVDSGANSVDGIRFAVSDTEQLLDEARKQAVAAARAKAEVFATAAGVELGDILSISESGIQMPRPVMMRSEMMMAGADAAPIQAGEETISASVTIRWSLAQD